MHCLSTRRVLPRALLLLAVAGCVLTLCAWLGWLAILQRPNRPWFGARLVAPRTTHLADLTVEAPAGYVLIAEPTRVWVERLWPAVSLNDVGQSLQIRIAHAPEALSTWAVKEHECGARPSGCQVRADTVHGRQVRCREITRPQASAFDTPVVSLCRAVGTRYWSLHTCSGVARCEVLHRTAIAALSSFDRDSGARSSLSSPTS